MSELSWGQTVPLWYESGLKPAVGRRHRPHAPARPEIRAHQPVDDGVDAVRRDDAAPEQVADVRAERVDLPLVAVEREHVEAAALVGPERLVEAVAELVGLAVEPLGELALAPDLPGELGHALLRVVDVSLHLDGRDRRLRDASRPRSAASPTSPSTTGCRGRSRSASRTRRSRRRPGRRAPRSRRGRAAPAPGTGARAPRRRSSARPPRGGSDRAASRRSCRSSARTSSSRPSRAGSRGRSSRARRRSTGRPRSPGARRGPRARCGRARARTAASGGT